jgi:hypothetical protein
MHRAHGMKRKSAKTPAANFSPDFYLKKNAARFPVPTPGNRM